MTCHVLGVRALCIVAEFILVSALPIMTFEVDLVLLAHHSPLIPQPSRAILRYSAN